MIRAIQAKSKTLRLEDVDIAEIRIAALLHDVGHGPFSHASEFVYDRLSPELQDIRTYEDKKTFGGTAGHEMISYLIVTSKRFVQAWNEIASLYNPTQDPLLCDLKKVDMRRVGLMILGRKPKAKERYMSAIVNGPFDADKFDYIIRDGYFSGLTTSIDIGRLAVSLDVGDRGGRSTLCMDMGGATILEQLLFSKMVLFSSMYHHHKVRAAFRQLVRLFWTAREEKIMLGGADLRSAAGFLYLDDGKALAYALKEPKLKSLAKSLGERDLPKRVLVIDRDTLSDINARQLWVQIGSDPSQVFKLEEDIAARAGKAKEDVCVDFPPEPSVYKTAKFSMIRRAPGRPLVPLDSLYPVAGWLSGYEQYRFRSYILCRDGCQDEIRDATEQELDSRGISIDYDLARRLAKW
jgi:HD superfamily phosphohydrolase